MNTPTLKLARAMLRTTFLLAIACTTTAGAVHAADLYGTSLNGANAGNPVPSTLYLINQSTGAGALVGSVGHAVNGLAFDPVTGLLYGSTTSWNPGFANGLLAINRASGAATTIGSGFGISNITSITIDGSGNMFGAVRGGDTIVRINKATGVATAVGPGPLGQAASVLAFDNANVLKLVRGVSVYDINTANGSGVLTRTPTTDPGDHGDFHPDTSLLWTSLTSGLTADSVIGVTNVAANTLATINTNIAYLHTLAFHVAPPPGLANFTLKRSSVVGCKSATGVLTLTAPAPAEGQPVTISDTLAAASPPATVRVSAGALTKSFAIKTSAVASNESGTVSATLGGTTIDRALTLTRIGASTVTLTPTTVVGGSMVNAVAKLTCKAGPGPILVELDSTLPAVANPTLPSVLVPVGVQTAAFQVTTSPVAVTTKPKIRARANGVTKSKTLTVTP